MDTQIKMDNLTASEQKRILVIDDNEVLCDLLGAALSLQGHAVVKFGSGEEAFRHLNGDFFHVALVDLVLPGINGLEVMKKIKEHHPMTEVVMMTSHASLQSAVVAMRSGAYDYLVKPFEDMGIVMAVVKRTLEKQQLTIDNDRLLRDIQKRNTELEETVKRLSSLHRLGISLYSLLDVEQVMRQIITIVVQQLQAQRASLMLIDEESQEMRICAAYGLSEEVVRKARVKVGEGISGCVAQIGEPLLVEDISADPRFQKRMGRSYVTDSFISAPLLLSVPIKVQERVVGVINVNNKTTGNVFNQADLDFVSTLASQAALAIENARLFEGIKTANLDTIRALAEALETKDAYTRGHSDRTMRHAVAIAQRMQLAERDIEWIRYAAILHDVGKIGIPEGILNKAGKLTQHEYNVMKKHPLLGAEVIHEIKHLMPVVPLVRHDHERWDGQGYPSGLRGKDIPLGARIIAAVDAFDAMTSNRPYRKAMPLDAAADELRRCAGTQFDPEVVTVFLEILNT